MRKRTTLKWLATVFGGLATVGALVVPSQSHHSFAMYDDQVTMVFTGVVVTVIPEANHQQIDFVLLNEERNALVAGPDGNPQLWKVEMGGSAASAAQGISVPTFPRGTIFSVGLNPLRSGLTAGSREGALFKCPANTPPGPGVHCDSVEGSTRHGEGELPTPVPAAPG